MTLPGIVITDEGVILDANTAALQLLNQPAVRVIGQPLSRIMNAALEDINDCCAGKRSSLELTLDNMRGIYTLQLNFNRITSPEGGLTHLVSIQDVSERKSEEQAREDLIMQLEAYASTIAHDLKAPLATLMGFASLLEVSGGSLREDQKHYAHLISKMSSKMSTLVDDLLLFASLQNLSHIPLTMLDINDLIADVQERLQSVIDYHQAVVKVAADLPSARGYAPWVEVVFANYISNAIKYGGAYTGSKAQIAISGDVIDGKVYYWVHDNGAGLSAEQREMLFKQSARFDPSKRGHGLGLLIVQRIVERLGGTVGVSSEPGTGSTFWFTLPVVQQPTETATAAATNIDTVMEMPVVKW
jgi:signal transduction histidine kinase